MSRFLPCFLTWGTLVFLPGCVMGRPGVGPSMTSRRAPAHYAQSTDSATSGCLRNPACYVQRGDEAVIPWMSRAADAVRTGVTVMRFLEAAEVARVEQVMVACANEANFEINERIWQGEQPQRGAMR
ncbi:hypothetical protein ACN28S_41195 [Cystobacter fuscus]